MNNSKISYLASLITGLAPLVFSPWMNISGSCLATFWHDRQSEAEIERRTVINLYGIVN